MGPGELPALVFDGDCGFCSSCAAWMTRRWRGPGRAVPWQLLDPEALEGLGLTGTDVESAAWWVDQEGRLWGGHLAVAEGLASLGGVWGTVGRLLARPPLCWLAAPVYRIVVRHRHRLPGGTPACRTVVGR